jgi:hypothetical protein
VEWLFPMKIKTMGGGRLRQICQESLHSLQG